MAFISVSGEPGCRLDELARMVAQRFQCDLVTEARLAELIASELGGLARVPDKAWPHVAVSILAKLGAASHVVVSCLGAELALRNLPACLRLRVVAPENCRIGNIMLDCGLDRPEAKRRLREIEKEQAAVRKQRFGQAGGRAADFDLVLNTETLASEQIVDVLESAVKSRRLLEAGPLSTAQEAEVQYQVRLRLARYGIVPPDRSRPLQKEFGHPSEEVFAHLLDFYRIAWDYEPRSFPLQWDKDGKVLEAFTPDFYLPEFDLYVELTTMKQANVTRKNRKIRLLRTIYPHVNIQVFYQKDVQDLVMKYGLPERLAQ
jgi:cytidylate kinase